MAESKKTPKDLEKELLERIELLEKKIETLEGGNNEKDESKKDNKKLKDSISETGEKIINESEKVLKSFSSATIEGMKESVDSLSSYSKKRENDKKEEFSKTVISFFRKTIDIQEKVLDKFEKSYNDLEK